MRSLARAGIGLALLAITVTSCGDSEDSGDSGDSADAPPADASASPNDADVQPGPEEGQMGGAGIRKDKANLYFNQGTLDDELGTRDGPFSQFDVECTDETVTVSTGDGVSAEFTVGSQEITFLLDGEEFATVDAGGDLEWGAGSSFALEYLQETVNGDSKTRVTFSGSVDCPQ